LHRVRPDRGRGRSAAGRSRRDRCIVFLHIPKTGGVTLRRTLKAKYSRILAVYQPAELGFDVPDSLQEALGRVPLSERAAAQVVSGHLHYGVHEYIPCECDYITVLREPVARVVSAYIHILGHPKHALHAELVRSSEPLETFLRIDPTVDNHQTRMLAGRGGAELTAKSPEPLGPEALEEAKRNLERFLVVGVTERFDETFILLRRALGWRLPYYVTANVAGGPKPVSESARELIRERNQLDLELYRFADRLLSTAVAEHGPSFPREVAAFRALNRVTNVANRHLSGPARRILRAALPR
jgi:Galactose-3-O-sulfotransferase